MFAKFLLEAEYILHLDLELLINGKYWEALVSLVSPSIHSHQFTHNGLIDLPMIVLCMTLVFLYMAKLRTKNEMRIMKEKAREDYFEAQRNDPF